MADDATTDPDTSIRAARALGDAGNNRGAIEVLERLLARHPDCVAGHYFLGYHLSNAGRHAEAVAACRAAVALDPSSPHAHRILGGVLGFERWGRTLALDHIRHAVALAPEDGFNHLALARGLERLSRVKAARASYREACERSPAEPIILAATAEHLFAHRRRREATAFAARAFAADPENVLALSALARARLLAGRSADALSLAEAAVARRADHGPAVATLIEAAMCRNPYFAVWSRVKGWMLGGKWRGPIVVAGLIEIWIGGMVAFDLLFPAAAPVAGVVFAATVSAAVWPNRVFKRRLAAALKPVRLRRRF